MKRPDPCPGAAPCLAGCPPPPADTLLIERVQAEAGRSRCRSAALDGRRSRPASAPPTAKLAPSPARQPQVQPADHALGLPDLQRLLRVQPRRRRGADQGQPELEIGPAPVRRAEPMAPEAASRRNGNRSPPCCSPGRTPAPTGPTRLADGRAHLRRAGRGDRPLRAAAGLRRRRARCRRARASCWRRPASTWRACASRVPDTTTPGCAIPGPITLRDGDGIPPARFPLHRAGAASSKPSRDDQLVASLHRRGRVRRRRARAHRLRAGRRRHRDRRRRHAAETWRCLHERHPGPSSRGEVDASAARPAAPGARARGSTTATSKATTPTRTSTRWRASPRPTRSSTRAATIPPTSTTPSCRRWRPSWPRCAPPTASPTGCSRCRGRSPILDGGRPPARRVLREFPHRQRRRADAGLRRRGRRRAPRAVLAAGLSRPRDRAGRLPPADLAERQPALPDDAVAAKECWHEQRASLARRAGAGTRPGRAPRRTSRCIERRVARGRRARRAAGAAAGTAQRRRTSASTRTCASSTAPSRSPARAPSASARSRRDTAW